MIQFFVPGTPIPKGSHKAQGKTKHGFTRITNANPRTKAWEERIAWAYKAIPNRDASIAGPVGVSLRFTFKSPKSVTREHHTVPPDVDKLARAALDGLMLGGVIEDDSQVTRLFAYKHYGEPAGVDITVEIL